MLALEYLRSDSAPTRSPSCAYPPARRILRHRRSNPVRSSRYYTRAYCLMHGSASALKKPDHICKAISHKILAALMPYYVPSITDIAIPRRSRFFCKVSKSTAKKQRRINLLFHNTAPLRLPITPGGFFCPLSQH